MRLCRYVHHDLIRIGVFCDRYIVPLNKALIAIKKPALASTMCQLDCLLPLLPPDGEHWKYLPEIESQLAQIEQSHDSTSLIPIDQVTLLPPIARPNKLHLLAGNYVEHIQEQGDQSSERGNTFPYVFIKPPSTSLIGSGATFHLPKISPAKIDYELELAVVIGRRCKQIDAIHALDYVAGYTVINDISDRGFRPNPLRHERPRDKFFDWLHGKWHDGSCPCGPCITTADAIPNPQALAMRLSIDGETRQDASTSLQVFSVAEVVAFISSFVTLEPGDIISTGTPSGVGNATGRYLQAGQNILATIDGIGTLETKVAASDEC